MQKKGDSSLFLLKIEAKSLSELSKNFFIIIFLSSSSTYFFKNLTKIFAISVVLLEKDPMYELKPNKKPYFITTNYGKPVKDYVCLEYCLKTL